MAFLENQASTTVSLPSSLRLYPLFWFSFLDPSSWARSLLPVSCYLCFCRSEHLRRLSMPMCMSDLPVSSLRARPEQFSSLNVSDVGNGQYFVMNE